MMNYEEEHDYLQLLLTTQHTYRKEGERERARERKKRKRKKINNNRASNEKSSSHFHFAYGNIRTSFRIEIDEKFLGKILEKKFTRIKSNFITKEIINKSLNFIEQMSLVDGSNTPTNWNN